jgi:methyl-accepting chemotaxis protein
MADKNPETLAAWKRQNQKVLALAAELKEQFTEDKSIQQANTVLTCYRQYEKLFLQYLENPDEQTTRAMTDMANRTVAAMEALREDQQEQLAEARKQNAAFVADKLYKADAANRLVKWLQDARIAQKNFMDTKDHAHAKTVDVLCQKIYDLCDELHAAMEEPRNREQVAGARAAVAGYHDNFQQWVGLWDQQEQVYARLADAAGTFMDSCQTLVAGQEAKMASTITNSNAVMLGGAGVAIVVGCVLACVITIGITRPINRIIAGLTSGAEQTTSAAGQVSSASQSLAEGASEQAAAIEETTASVEEMASMTRQNASNAEEAKNLAASANGSAQKGSTAMGRMSQAIDDIKKSSDETAKIVKTIDEIAFQTNLLALNAAVEAARAGEAGKGFAVVAEEVRNLAQRSAEAARNTADMIEGSVSNADNGVQISQEVEAALTEIAEGSGKVNDLVGEIAAASNEQAQGIEQINTAVTQMDQVTQKNAANAEESASASEELSAQAEELNSMVQQLRGLVEGAASVHHQPDTSRRAQLSQAPPHAERSAKPAANRPAAPRQPEASPAEAMPLDDGELGEF